MRELLPILLTLVPALLAAAAAPTHAAAPIRLGTIVPSGSSYHRHLQEMGAAWRQAPAGGAALTIYANGTMGGEAEMVRRMRIGQLQAGLISVEGLTTIEPAVAGLQAMPMMFRSLDEVDHVGAKLQPMLDRRLREKGFVVLAWVDAGWVRFFSRRPVVHPADLQRMRLFTWAGDAAALDIYESAGFDPVPLETSDILLNLQTGLIDAVPMPPFAALAGQIDKPAPHMLALDWAPLVGALVVTARAWDALPEATREAMLAAAREAGRRIKSDSRQEAAASVAAMQKRGLRVQAVAPEVAAEWRQAAAEVYPRIRGSIVPADVFDQVVKLLAAYRASAVKGSP